jgi:dihydrofolate reductase
MAKLNAFCFITLNGFYKGLHEDISWHNFGEDEQKISDELSNKGNTLLFGRVTYEMMASYWTSKEALKNDPVTAKGMNKSKKVVFSKTLDHANWQNTVLIKNNIKDAVQNLKQESESNLTILGSGQIVSQLSDFGLIDSYTFMVNPIAFGRGTSIFSGLSKNLSLQLDSTQSLKSGNVILKYF